MKILRIIASMDPSYGGPCQGIRNTVPEQEKMGVQNMVVCMDSPDASFMGKDSFTVVGLGPAKYPWLYTDKLSPWLEKNIDNYDAVIIHGLWLYYSYATYQIVKKRKQKGVKVPKLFVMPHGMLDPYFQKAEERKLKSIRNYFYWTFIEKKVVNYADALLFTCEEELELARTTFPNYHPKKELNVSYGIAAPPPYSVEMAEAFHNVCTGLGNSPYLLFLSRIHQKKGTDLLIKAYKQLEAQGKGLPKLIIVGPGMDASFGEQLRKEAEKSSNIFFPGMLSGNAKWGAFYGCDAFILPSHQENFGIAVVEALACGKPVLISNKVNIWNEIAECSAGFIEEDSSSGVLELLSKWLNTTDNEKRKMGTDANSCYLQNFTSSYAAKRLVDCVSLV